MADAILATSPPLSWTREELFEAGRLLYELRKHIYLTGHPREHYLLDIAVAVLTDTRTGSLVRPPKGAP
jgi:hypothetical protein